MLFPLRCLLACGWTCDRQTGKIIWPIRQRAREDELSNDSREWGQGCCSEAPRSGLLSGPKITYTASIIMCHGTCGGDIIQAREWFFCMHFFSKVITCLWLMISPAAGD